MLIMIQTLFIYMCVMEAQKLNLKQHMHNKKDALRLFNGAQRHLKCIHTENIITCYDSYYVNVETKTI